MQKSSKKANAANGAAPKVSAADLDAAVHEAVASEQAQVIAAQASTTPTDPEPSVDATPTSDATQTELASVRGQLLRLAADFDNYRKRTRTEQDDIRRHGVARLLADLLPVVDNLQRALVHAPQDSQDPVIQGIQMVTKQWLDVLANYGVKTFSSQGARFDPERHEAVGQQTSATSAPNTVLTEMQSGYMIYDRLLRPARVVVADHKSGAEMTQTP